MIRPRQRLKGENRNAAVLLKIRLKGRKIRLSEPICDPTGNAQFSRANLEQLLDQGVDRVLITAAGSGFVESVNKERRTGRNIPA